MQRIEIYKLMAEVLLTRTYRLEEMPHISPIMDYLKQEIENHESAETANDSGAQG